MVGKPGSGRPGGNPDLKVKGQATKFKKGHKLSTKEHRDPEKAAEKASTRAQMRYLIAQDISTDPAQLDAEISRLLQVGSVKAKAPISRIIALRAIEKVIKTMDNAALSTLIENTEGKMAQEIILPSKVEAPTTATTVEEAAANYKEFMPK